MINQQHSASDIKFSSFKHSMVGERKDNTVNLSNHVTDTAADIYAVSKCAIIDISWVIPSPSDAPRCRSVV